MAKPTELQSFDNRGYVADDSNISTAADPNDNNINRYGMKGGENNNKDETHIPNMSNMSPEEIRSEKRRIMKNVIVISFAFLLLFTAFQSMSALQSSINKVSKKYGKHYYCSYFNST